VNTAQCFGNWICFFPKVKRLHGTFLVVFPRRSCVWSNTWCYPEIRGIVRPNGLYALPPLGVISSMLCACVPTVVKLKGRVIKGSAFCEVMFY